MSDKPNAEVQQLRNQLDELRASDPTPQVEAAKQQVSDTVSNAAASVSNAAANVTEAVAEPIRQGMDKARSAVAGARRTAAQVSAQTEDVTQQIRSQPFMALGMAAVAGYVFGRIVR